MNNSQMDRKRMKFGNIYCHSCFTMKDKKTNYENCKICAEYYCPDCHDNYLEQVPLRYLEDEQDWEYGEFICSDCVNCVKKMQLE